MSEPHQDSRDGESLLSGVGYDFWAGELDLLRLGEAPADTEVRALVGRFLAGGAAEQEIIRSSLNMDALYTVLTFSHRCAVRALREEDAAAATDAVDALALIDSDRVDWRDTVVAVGVTSHVLRSLTPDPASILTLACQLAEPSTAEIMTRFIEPSSADATLASWGYMQVETSVGRGLIHRGIASYAPTVALVELALRIGASIEDDLYRASSISAAEKLHAVWLPSAPKPKVDAILAGCRAAVTVNARLRPAANPDSESQQFTFFIAEPGKASEARRLDEWSAIRPDSSHVSLAWHRGPVFVLLVARSFTVGIEPFETEDSLERFRQPVADIIAESV